MDFLPGGDGHGAEVGGHGIAVHRGREGKDQGAGEEVATIADMKDGIPGT